MNITNIVEDEILTYLTLIYGDLDDPLIIHKIPNDVIADAYIDCYPDSKENSGYILATVFTIFANSRGNQLPHAVINRYKPHLWKRLYDYHIQKSEAQLYVELTFFPIRPQEEYVDKIPLSIIYRYYKLLEKHNHFASSDTLKDIMFLKAKFYIDLTYQKVDEYLLKQALVEYYEQ